MARGVGGDGGGVLESDDKARKRKIEKKQKEYKHLSFVLHLEKQRTFCQATVRK